MLTPGFIDLFVDTHAIGSCSGYCEWLLRVAIAVVILLESIVDNQLECVQRR